MAHINYSEESSADSTSDSRGSSPSLASMQDPRDQSPRPPMRATTSNFNNLRPYMQRNSSAKKICICLRIIIFLFIIAIISAAAILLHVMPPKFSVNDIAVDGLNNITSTLTSPAFNVTLVSKIPRNKIGVRYYIKGSSVSLYYSDTSSCDGIASRISKTSNNMLVIEMALKCKDAVLPRDDLLDLENDVKSKNVVLRLNLKVPIKLTITWKLALKVKCDTTMDGLVRDSNISSEICKSKVWLW